MHGNSTNRPIFGCVIIGNRLGMRMEFAGRCWSEDENLIAIEELGEEVEYTGIFRGSVADWRHVCCYIKHISRAEQRNRSVRLCLRLHGYGKRLFLETVYYFLIFTV